jgi:hypothetical protein
MFLVLDIGSRGFFDRGDIVDYRIGQSDKEKEGEDENKRRLGEVIKKRLAPGGHDVVLIRR